MIQVFLIFIVQMIQVCYKRYGVVGVFRLFKPHASTYTTSYADTLGSDSSTLIYRGSDADYHGTACQSHLSTQYNLSL